MRQRHRVSGCERWSGQSHHGPCCSRWGAGDARVGSACSLVQSAPEEFIMHRIEKCDKGRPAGHTHATKITWYLDLTRGTGPPPRPRVGLLLPTKNGHALLSGQRAGTGAARRRRATCAARRRDSRPDAQAGSRAPVERWRPARRDATGLYRPNTQGAMQPPAAQEARSGELCTRLSTLKVDKFHIVLVLATLRAHPSQNTESIVLISLT